jgi:hypothetical protein
MANPEKVAWKSEDDGRFSWEASGGLGIEEVSLNNNNNRGNNRRRGRGNSRPNGGGGQQLNRIDSRARGNAPQMLEKYRKLAHDSHLNGDRVNEEYFLQFADHYFRVIADARVRTDETRQGQGQVPGQGPRRDDRWSENGDSGSEFGDESSEYNDGYDDVRNNERYERAERPERQERQERQERPERQDRAERPERQERQPVVEQRPAQVAEEAPAPLEAEEQSEDASRNPYEPVANPFVREGRSGRGLKQRRPREERSGGEVAGQLPLGDSLDPSALPPAVSASRPVAAIASEPEQPDAAEEAVAKPKRRARRPRQSVDDKGEALQPVT